MTPDFLLPHQCGGAIILHAQGGSNTRTVQRTQTAGMGALRDRVWRHVRGAVRSLVNVSALR
jgi:hypothetical protein